MAVMRVHKNANYTVMSNYHFKEKKMSLKAKGLLSLMLSLPNDWDYSIAGLATLSKDGKDSVMGALKELEQFGYLTRTRLTNEKGQFDGYDYDIYEEPISTKPYSENPNTENPTQLNTNKIITKKNKDKKIKDKRAELINNNNDLEFERKNVTEPNEWTKQLIEVNYIEKDSLYIHEFNTFFNQLYTQYGFEILRSVLWYFVKRIKTNGTTDENGDEIQSKLYYCKVSLERAAERLANPTQVPAGLSFWLE